MTTAHCDEVLTQIVVFVDPDTDISARLTAVQVTMRRSGATEVTDAGTYPIPQHLLRTDERDGHLVLRPRDPADARLVVITVTGVLRDREQVSFSVATRFQRGRTLYLDAPLVAACARVTGCPEGTTCREGTCVPVPEQTLPEAPAVRRDAMVEPMDATAPDAADASLPEIALPDAPDAADAVLEPASDAPIEQDILDGYPPNFAGTERASGLVGAPG